MKDINTLAMEHGMTRATIRKYIKQGYTFMIMGVSNNQTVDRAYAKTLEEVAELEKAVSGDNAYTVRLTYIL